MRMSDRFRKDFPEETIEICADVYVLKVGNHYVREGRLFDELKEADHYDCIGPMTGRDSLRMATDASELVPGSRVVKVRKVRKPFKVGDRVRLVRDPNNGVDTRCVGKKGRVTDLLWYGSFGVRFDDGPNPIFRDAWWFGPHEQGTLKRLRPKASP